MHFKLTVNADKNMETLSIVFRRIQINVQMSIKQASLFLLTR